MVFSYYKGETINRKLVHVVLVLFITLQIVVNFDSGAIAAGLNKLSDKYHLEIIEQGLLNSYVYVGLSISSLIIGSVLVLGNEKWILVASLLLNIASNAVFAMAPAGNKQLLLYSRMFVGFSQATMVIYAPVWVDEFSPTNQCTLWMSLVQGGVSLGVMLGYLITGVLNSYIDDLDASRPFQVQVGLLILPTICLVMIPSRYINEGKDKDDIDSEHEEVEDLVPETEENSEDKPLLGAHHGAKKSYLSKFSHKMKENICIVHKNSKDLLKRPLYFCIVFALSSLYFVVTSVQLYMTDYLMSVVGAESATVTFSFSAVSASAPITGVLFGGWVTDRIGGYKGHEGVKNTARLGTMFAFIAVCFALPMIWVRIFSVVITCTWFLLFFGAAILPPATGILMACVPKELRAFSSSMSALFYNWLGYFLGPVLTAYVKQEVTNSWEGIVDEELAKNYGKIAGMQLTFSWAGFGLIFMTLAWIFAWKDCKQFYAHQAENEDWDEYQHLPARDELEYEMCRGQMGQTLTVSLGGGLRSTFTSRSSDSLRQSRSGTQSSEPRLVTGSMPRDMINTGNYQRLSTSNTSQASYSPPKFGSAPAMKSHPKRNYDSLPE